MHLALYALALFGLSQSANLVKWAQAPIEVLGFWRLALCGLAFLPFALRGPDLKSLLSKVHRQELFWALVSGSFFFLHLWTFFYASVNTSIANCMVIFSINPLFTAVGAYWFFGERFTWRLAFAYVFAFTGIYLLVSQSLSFDQGLVKGDLMALLSGLLVSVYLLSGKRVRHGFSNVTFSVVIYFVAALGFLSLVAIQATPLIGYSDKTWLAILGLVVIPTFLGHSLFMYLVKYMNINLMTCGKLIEPVMSSAVAFLVFGETLKPTTVAAFALTSASVLILFEPEFTKLFKKWKQAA